MNFDVLGSCPVSVNDIVHDVSYDGNHVAIHGILYCGQETSFSEFICVPKNGGFDGVYNGIIKGIEKSTVLLIDESGLKDRLKHVVAGTGGYLYQYDAIIFAKVRRQNVGAYKICLTDLWFMCLQNSSILPSGTNLHRMYFIDFKSRSFPTASWESGIISERKKGRNAIGVYLNGEEEIKVKGGCVP